MLLFLATHLVMQAAYFLFQLLHHCRLLFCITAAAASIRLFLAQISISAEGLWQGCCITCLLS